MKKSLFVTMIIAAMLFCFATVSFAKDVQITKEIKSITIKKDKNNKEYVRIIVSDNRTLNGVTYKKDVSVMAFGDVVEKAKTYKKGQTLNAIAAESQYRGSTSYTILEII